MWVPCQPRDLLCYPRFSALRVQKKPDRQWLPVYRVHGFWMGSTRAADCDSVIRAIMYSTRSSLQGKMLSFKTICPKEDVLMWSFVITNWQTTLRSTSQLLSFAICLLEHRIFLLSVISNHLTSGKVQAVGNTAVPIEMGTK